jgi:hypothetical protein
MDIISINSSMSISVEKIDARLVPRLARTSVRSGLAADRVPDVPLSLTHAGAARALLLMDEPIALEPPDGHLDNLPFLTGDDGSIADDVCDVFLDGLFDLLSMPGGVFEPPLGELPFLLSDSHLSYSSFLRISPTNWSRLSAQTEQ